MIVANMTAAAVASRALSGSFAVAASSPAPAQRVREVVLDRSAGHLLVAAHLGRHEISVWVARPTLTCLEGGQRDVAALASLGQTLCSCGRRAGDAGPPSGLAVSSNHGQACTTHAIVRVPAAAQPSRDSGRQPGADVCPGQRPRDPAEHQRGDQMVCGSRDPSRCSPNIHRPTGRGLKRRGADKCMQRSYLVAAGSPALRLLARDNAAHGSLVGIGGADKVWKYCGGTWFAQGTAPEGPHALTTIESDGNLTLIVAAENGLQRSSNWGATWMDVATW